MKKPLWSRRFPSCAGGAPEAQALYAETEASIAKRENAAAMRKAGATGMTTDGKPSKKQRRDLFKFRGSGNDD